MSLPANPFSAQLDILNASVLQTFGTELITYQRMVDGEPLGDTVEIQSVPIDPLRLEGMANGNFAVRFVQKVDLLDWAGEPFTPAQGDTITLPDSTLTVGGLYTLFQIQEDIGGGIRLILDRRKA